MSLTTAINTAQTSLSNTSTQTNIVSRNIANAANPDYNRRNAALSTNVYGAQVVAIQRAQDQALFQQSIKGTSSAAGQQSLLTGLTGLKSIFGGNDYETSPAALLGTLRDTLSTFAAQPGEATLAQTAVADAQTLADGFRNAANAVQRIRLDADQEIEREVDKLNLLLERFETANNNVFQGTEAGRDVSAHLDDRDSLLKQIAQIVGVTPITRSGNDMALYTRDGTTLFETSPRPVTFDTSTGFSASIQGNPIYIDGVPLAAGQGATSTANGSLQGLLQIRDDIAPKVQTQLDEVARALIVTFAEKDQSAIPTLPDQPGLFTWSAGTVPAGSTIVAGISATITVNPALVPALGGDPKLLRDGGINGAAYNANPAGAASFSAQIDAYVVAIDAPIGFDPAAGLSMSTSLMDFAADSMGWLELNRSEAASAAESREAFRFRADEAYSNDTGVSIDEEMSMLLELEQSYKASARLISAVDQMLQALMAVVR
jgi:flagellar hook-associated protein 1 FlgK